MQFLTHGSLFIFAWTNDTVDRTWGCFVLKLSCDRLLSAALSNYCFSISPDFSVIAMCSSGVAGLNGCVQFHAVDVKTSGVTGPTMHGQGREHP